MNRFWRALASTSAFVVVASLAVPQPGYAQMGNGASAIGKPVHSGTSGAGTMGAGPSTVKAASAPVGPGLSPMPLTTPAVMPFEDTTGSLKGVGQPGSSLTPTTAVKPQAYSMDLKWPYTTARVAVVGPPGPGTANAHVPVTSKPYRQTGKLWMYFSTSPAGWYVCTASLIKKGVLVTAAHCIHRYGQQAAGFPDEVRWYPANFYSGGGLWGYYSAVHWRVPTPYYNGTDTCQTGANGIVCNNDIATVVLETKSGLHAGQFLGGWYSYAWNNFSFIQSPVFGNATVGEITQLGYPVAFDNGYMMQRNNSLGKYVTTTSTTNGQMLRNVQLGSAMTGGSSGGPWLVNFGGKATIDTSEASYGTQPANDVVVAVTSWGYTAVGLNVQGASFFGQNAEYPGANYGGRGPGNIGAIVNDTCVAYPSHC